ncbi:MAG TPA: ABC transporter ATP-binding protein, partial [Anaerovoracaceae bacterium]|nr:ABC transporter ATP-binding protein [Anaerovoracaceae bacterium]
MNSVGKITMKVLKAKPIYVVAMILLVAAVVLLSLIPPQILRIIIDEYLLAGVTKGLFAIAVIYLASYVLIGVFDFLKAYLLTVAGQKIIKEIRIAMEQKLTRLKSSYFTKNSVGALSSKFMNNVDNINTLFTEGVISMVIDCFKILGIVVSIWIFSYKLAIFAIALIPIVAVITAYFRRRMLRAQITNLAQVGKVNNHIVESIKNIIMIKTFNKEGYMESTYKKHLDENYKTMARVSFFDSSYSPIIQIMTAMAISFVFYFASGDSNILGISIGEIAAATNLITNLFTPIDTLGMELQSIQKGLSGIKSVDEFLA